MRSYEKNEEIDFSGKSVPGQYLQMEILKLPRILLKCIDIGREYFERNNRKKS